MDATEKPTYLVIEQMLDSYGDRILGDISHLKQVLREGVMETGIHPHKEKHLRGKLSALSVEFHRFKGFKERIKKMARHGEIDNTLLKDTNSVNWRAIQQRRKEKNAKKQQQQNES